MVQNIHTISTHFNRASSTYDSVADLQQSFIVKVIDKFSPLLPSRASIADLGCGTGYFARLAKKQGLDWQITGVDMAQRMCEQAAPLQYQTLHEDMHHTTLTPAQMDASLCAFALQWSHDPKQAIAEIARITKPGGICIILTFLDGTLGELAHCCRQLGIPPKTNHFYTAREYERWFAAAKLSVQSADITHTTLTYPTPMVLFQTLKRMGATNSNHTIKGLNSRRDLRAISDFYQQYYQSEGAIPASWKVGFWVLEK